MFAFLIRGIVLGGTAAAQPGPFQAYLFSQTIKNGWKRTLPAAFAPLLSDIPIIFLALFALSQAPSWLLTTIQIIGGFFILYLAYRTYLASKTAVGETSIQESVRQNLFQAVLVNSLAPGPYIFWGTIGGPIILEGWRQLPLHGIGFLFGFYIALVGGFSGFIALFSSTKKLDERFRKVLTIISIIILSIVGIYQIGLGIGALVKIILI